MKNKILIIILSLILTSCNSQVIVWNVTDIIGFAITTIVMLIIAILFLIDWIKNKWNKRK